MGGSTRDLRTGCGRPHGVRRGRRDRALSDFDPEARVGHLLRRAYHRANGLTSDALRDLGITPVQAATVMAVRRAGSLSAATLGRAIGMEPGNVHGLVARMVKLELLTVEPHPTDQRRQRISLTPLGHARAVEIARCTAASTQAALAPLDERERALFLDMLRRVALVPPTDRSEA